MGTYLLGIDNGGTIIKAALYDRSGREVAAAGSKIEMVMPQPGWTERDAEALWAANTQAIAAVLQKSEVDPTEVAALATTGHGNGLYLVDDAGKPVYPGIYSTDARGREYVERWYADGTFEKIFPKTLQSIWAGQPVALLAWFRDHRPEVLDQARWICMCKDYIRLRLTGEPYAEITDISGTNLMNVRDQGYDRQLLEDLGLAGLAEKLPPLKNSAEICGYVTDEAAAATGLKVGTPVAGGLFDIDACAIATGITSAEKLCIIAGTWSINQYISTAPVVSKTLFMASLYCLPGHWLVTEASATSASNLEWFVTQLLEPQGEVTHGARQNIYDGANTLVAGTEPEDSDLYFLPFLYGSNAGADAKACFIGLTGRHTKAEMLRAIYEGVVFSHKVHIERLLAYREPPAAARISGGVANSPIWLQIFADILQTPIEVTRGTELGTLGAAMCAGVATGDLPSLVEAAEDMVAVVQTYLPNQAKRDCYTRKYDTYKKIVQALSAIWPEI